MRVAIITDTHWGGRNDNLALMDYMKRFLDDVFFPTLQRHDITTVVIPGDLVDRRKFININTANRMKQDFLDPLASMGIRVLIIPGNHDVYFKDTIEVNALDVLLKGYENVTLYMHPSEVELGKTRALMLPWVCDANREECMNAVTKTKAPILFGHLQIEGFEMHKGTICDHGHSADIFDKFDLVLSGHFHHKSSHKNIFYLGNPFEMTWGDYGDQKGFHLFDTDTRELEFIPNPYHMFLKVHYSDEGKEFNEVLNVDFAPYKDTYVKVVVQSKTNPFLYDSFIQKLEEAGPIDVKAVDDHLNLAIETNDDIIDEAESTLDILTETIRQSGIKAEYQKPLDELLRSLYNEAGLLQA